MNKYLFYLFLLLITFVLRQKINKNVLFLINTFIILILYLNYKTKEIQFLFILLTIIVYYNNIVFIIDENILNINNNNKSQEKFKYDKIQVDDASKNMLSFAKNNEDYKKMIQMKMVDVYGLINSNKEIKNFLIFNNLIDNNGMPLYSHVNEESKLLNEIKILLVVSIILSKQ